MRPIDADHLKETFARLQGVSSDKAWEAVTNRMLHDVAPKVIDDEPTVKVVTEEQYNAAVVKLLNDLRTRACSTGPISTADKGVLLLLDALMKCLLKGELFGGKEDEETNHSGMC